MKHLLTILAISLICTSWLKAQESKLSQFLRSIPGAEVKKEDSSGWNEYYVVLLPQLVDHNNPGGPSFLQRIFVGHRGFDRPTVMETEGYSADWMNGYMIDEPSRLLNANQLYVEHRYCGRSIPENMNWRYLTAEQDAADYHYIRQLFGKIYQGKWISTGVSKGGQTATEYKVFYPDDVDVTIPYVAPINYKLRDKRIDRHFEKVGTEECRNKLTAIQTYLLKNKSITLPIYERFCDQQGIQFKIMEPEVAFDYSVLELPFSFWQYTADCSVLPQVDNPVPDKMVRFLISIVTQFYYSDPPEFVATANYQFYSQLGYYEYDERPFRKYLKQKDYPNALFLPKGADVKWDKSYIKRLKKFMRQNPQHMIYIYGEMDPWGATAARIKPGKGSLKITVRNGTHGSNISSMSPEQKAEVIGTLEKWLNLKIDNTL